MRATAATWLAWTLASRSPMAPLVIVTTGKTEADLTTIDVMVLTEAWVSPPFGRLGRAYFLLRRPYAPSLT